MTFEFNEVECWEDADFCWVETKLLYAIATRERWKLFEYKEPKEVARSWSLPYENAYDVRYCKGDMLQIVAVWKLQGLEIDSHPDWLWTTCDKGQ